MEITASGSTVTVSIEGVSRAFARWVAETAARIVGGARVTVARVVRGARAVVSLIVDAERLGVAAVAVFEIAESLGLVTSESDAEAAERATIEATASAWMEHIAECRHELHVANSWARHRHEFGAAADVCETIAARRIMLFGRFDETAARTMMADRAHAFDVKLANIVDGSEPAANDDARRLATG